MLMGWMIMHRRTGEPLSQTFETMDAAREWREGALLSHREWAVRYVGA